ncbi:spore coat protein [Cohnella sp. CFH 77786]|nr:spore coat protein [Cohnella sp. CFH 77786]MBW5447091.1 spore coat protein [Cohnella sp. CFH 77786]
MHELVASQANHLTGFKMHLPNVQDPALKALYTEAIQGTEQNLRDLLPYYPMAPKAEMRAAKGADMTAFFAGHLLGYAKSAVRNYAIAITETATPALRETFQKHLLKAIQLHGKTFAFMHERGLYPAYQLDRLLANDQKSAQAALSS